MGLREHHSYGLQADRLLAAETWDEARPTFSGQLALALVFPNAYRFGMANLGYLTVHRLAASVPGIGIERFFPTLTTGQALTPPYYSLETRRPLGDFPIMAWSFSFEGDFDTIPALLGPLGIPVRRSDRRRGRFPLLIAGGAAVAANPASLSEIFDVLVPGEAEPVWPLMLQRFLSKGPLAGSVADLPGVWVPEVRAGPNPPEQPHDVAAQPAFSHVTTTHQVFPGAQLLEVMRGCPRGCRFCLARVIYAPSRPVPLSMVTTWLEQRPDQRDIGLVAPSLFDHPEVSDILRLLAAQGKRLFNSSVKWERLPGETLSLLRQCGVKSLTLAPETGSTRLQTLMGKALRPEAFFATLASIAAHGFEQVKLYFLFGLPQEGEEDLNETVTFLTHIADIARDTGLGATASFAPFVPKQGTPWADQEFAGLERIKAAMRVLRSGLHPLGKTLKTDFASPRESARQAHLAGIGPELAEELHEEALAWRDGKRPRAGDFDHGSF